MTKQIFVSGVCAHVSFKSMLRVNNDGEIFYFARGIKDFSTFDLNTFLSESEIILVADWWCGLICKGHDTVTFKLSYSEHDDPVISSNTTDLQLSKICSVIEHFTALIIEDHQVIQGDMYQMLTCIREGVYKQNDTCR